MSNSQLADAAIAYARAGYAVLPLKPGTKRPATIHGKDDATTDVETVRRWWHTNPDANIGLRPAQGVVIIDVDTRKDGHASLADRSIQLGPLPDDAPVARTPTGGLHIWVSGVDGDAVATLASGIDVKTNSGYVVAPPSAIGGHRYTWRTALLDRKPPAAADEWATCIRKPERAQPNRKLRKPVGHQSYVDKAVAEELDALRSCEEGGGRWRGRYDELNGVAIRLARMPEVDRQWLRGELIEACRINEYLADEGIRKVQRDITSAFTYADGKGPAPIPEPTLKRDDMNGVKADVDRDAETDSSAEESDVHAHAVRVRAAQIRVEREARAIVDAEALPIVVYPPVTPLTELLEEPDEALHYRIDQVAPKQGNIILSAQFKAGKTTLVNNLIRSLVDSDPFLGRFTVTQPAQHLVLIDNEMSRNTLRRWLREQKIRNTQAVADVITLRGRVSTFNILDAMVRDQWARRLADLGCDYLMFDCLRPVLDALGLDENRDVGKFLVAFDALLADAGIPDSFIVQHMGHANERSRGDSRLLDWPDATWRVVRETEAPDSPRFFAAYGRDVDVYEGRLSFDPVTRRLTYAAGSRSDAKTEAAVRAMVALLAVAREPMSYRGIEDGLAGVHTQKAIRDGIGQAVKTELVIVESGPKRAKLHRINYPCSECGYPVASRSGRHQSCPTGPDELNLQ